MCSCGGKGQSDGPSTGYNETSGRASSEALEAAPLRVFRVQLRVEHNSINWALADRADVLRHAPAAETVRARDVSAARDARRRFHRPKADRALVDTCVESKFRAPHSVDAT